MKKLIAILLLGVMSAAAQGLTREQKEADFRKLAALYAGLYGPLDWKKTAFGFDALRIQPWLERVAATDSDLAFYEVCQEYIANLRDSHVTFTLPSDFWARLGFGVDVYEGALLIDAIDRTALPAARYPFAIGDELLSIDGESAIGQLSRFEKSFPQANPVGQKRYSAMFLTSRQQRFVPRAPEVGDEATVVIRRQNGEEQSFTLPWIKSGTPLEVGPVPSPKTRAALGNDPVEGMLRNMRVEVFPGMVNGIGARNPIFVGGLPSTFTRRLGGAASDFFFSGVFRWDDLRIGFLRIPSWAPPSQALALSQLDAEVAFLNANTDGLIIDDMRNPGGNACFVEAVTTRLIPYPFRSLGVSMTPYAALFGYFNNLIINAKNQGAPWDVIAQHESNAQEFVAANRQGRLTRPLSLCGNASLTLPPTRNAAGEVTAYNKPILVLVDEFSISGADAFAALMQDANRAVLYGMRTAGAGGNVANFDAGVYSEASTRVTLGLMIRNGDVVTPEYPTAPYVENIGVRPEITVDYMTKDNLLNGGATFVRQFVESMAAYIRQQQR